ncbi:hypothetical protein RJT34_18606 [Clitoria ternatea]|uniref:Uncharacterized protein n=1 Tax=Clitoria ternatea TaxID=43366 RepID=A0AAN9JB43_CLITE
MAVNEIERKISEAEKYKAEDEKRQKNVEARHALEKYAYSIRGVMSSMEDSFEVSEEDKERINDKVGHVLQWLAVNVDYAEEADFELMHGVLSSIFNLVIVKLIKGEDNCGVTGSAVGSSSNNNGSGKSRWLSILVKFALKAIYSAVTGDIIGVIVDCLSN